MSKRMLIMLILTGFLFGSIFAYKGFQAYMIKKYMKANAHPPSVVSACTVISTPWQPKLTATGSLRAINGVDITTEIAGLVKKIVFTPGQNIQAGDVILELNADTEIAHLKSLEAQADLALITFKRDKEQFAVQGVSQATLDASEADFKSKTAQVTEQVALIEKKIIRAPFKGRLGISAVNLGQYLNPGDKIVTLQSLDPIYVDFYVPQQAVPQLAVDQPVILVIDTYPGVLFKGNITSMNPKVDSITRNIEVEATLSNSHNKLFPGMYGLVEINTGSSKDYLTVPQTALSYNPYGDLVYLLKEKEKDKKGNSVFVAHQKFVVVGETRGDQIQILKGVEKGDQVVTAGQLKLKNGSLVIINNDIVPTNDSMPHLQNE